MITIPIGLEWIIGIGVFYIIMTMAEEKNPLKWPVCILGHRVSHFESSIQDREIEQWINDNIGMAKYTVYKKPLAANGWRKYFLSSSSLRVDYMFLFKSDAMAFKLRWT